MNGEDCVQRPLFGGAISSWFPLRLQDLSNITHVPDHQEVFADPQQDESLVFELLELKHDVEDSGSAVRFLRDLAGEQDALETMVIAKGRQGREVQNLVRVYVANLRLQGISTDVVISAYEPILIDPLSESANTVGAGVATAAAQAGCLPVAEAFKLAMTSFKVHDCNLFCSEA